MFPKIKTTNFKLMENIKSVISNHYFVLTVLALFFYLFRLGSYDFYEWDEPYYSSRALMVLQHNEIIDQSSNAIGGLWTGSHPPLVIWCMALSVKLLGVSEFGFRFPVAIAGVLLVIFFYKLVLLLFNKKIAFYAALILCLNSYVTQYSRMAQLDIPVLLFCLLSFYYLVKGLNKDFYNYFISGLFLGLALLSKIIVGFLIPIIFFSFILYILIKEKRLNKKIIFGLFAQYITALIIAFPWYLLITLQQGAAYWEMAMQYHVLGRMGKALENHSSPLGYFYWLHQTLIRLNLFIPFLLYGFYVFAKKNILRKDLKILIILWLVIPFLVFTVTATKYPTYILNFILPEILFCSIGIYDMFENFINKSKTALFILLSLSSLTWALTLPFQHNLENAFSMINSLSIPDWKDISILILFIAGSFLIYFLLKKLFHKVNFEPQRLLVKYLVTVFIIYFILNFNSLIRKGDFWIETRAQILDSDLKNKNSLIFVGEKISVNEFNLQILNYYTGLFGYIVSPSQFKDKKKDDIENAVIINKNN